MRRREYLTLSGLALGSVIIPAPIARLIRETCVDKEEPLIITPRLVRSTLLAVEEFGEYTLHFGDPNAEPETPTWEDWLDMNGVETSKPKEIKEYFRDQYGHELGEEPEINLADRIDGEAYESWYDQFYSMSESSTALAYHYLQGLPICPDKSTRSEDPLGALSFIEGPEIGNYSIYAQAGDLATIACLQHRLNELGEEVQIEIQ